MTDKGTKRKIRGVIGSTLTRSIAKQRTAACSTSSQLHVDALSLLRDLVNDEFRCAICLDICTDTHLNPECGHRFCGLCIKNCLAKCRNECPNCRAHIPTYRSLREDPQFDRILSKVQLAIQSLVNNPEKDGKTDEDGSAETEIKMNSATCGNKKILERKEKLEVGSRIRIWWPYEKQYFSGTVDTIEDERPDPHHIRYDDGDEEWTNLLDRNFKQISIRAISCDVSTARGNADFSMASIEELSGCDSDFGKRAPISAINTLAHRKRSVEPLNSNPTSHTGTQASIEIIDLCSEESPGAQKGDRKSRITATDHTYTVNNCQKGEWKETCSLCENEAKLPRATSCGHIFCRLCIMNSEAVAVCPVCNAAVDDRLQKYKPDHKSFKAVEALLETTAEVAARYNSASAASLQSKNGLSPSRIIDACCSFRSDGCTLTYQGYYWRFVG